MQKDLELRTKQSIWETPRNIVIMLALVAAIAGVLGFKLGDRAPPAPQVIYLSPAPAR